MSQINYTDYDRITDILMYLSNNITLNFNVVMSKKDKNGARQYYQYEAEYVSKYIGTNKSRSIKRNMNFYFTIDNKNDFANGFILRPQDVMMLDMIISEQILPWFMGKNRIFGIIDNVLVIKGNYTPVLYTQSEYKYLSFSPIIYSFEDGSFKEGVRICLNSESEYADIDIDKFLGFYYILKNTDMYCTACNMLTFVKQPPYGINTFSMTGLGGGYIQDTWNDTPDITIDNNVSKNKKNNFLDNIKRKD